MGRNKLEMTEAERKEHFKALGAARSKRFYENNKEEMLKARGQWSKLGGDYVPKKKRVEEPEPENVEPVQAAEPPIAAKGRTRSDKKGKKNNVEVDEGIPVAAAAVIVAKSKNNKKDAYSVKTLLARFIAEVPTNESTIRDANSIKKATRRSYYHSFKKVWENICPIPEGSDVLKELKNTQHFLDKFDTATFIRKKGDEPMLYVNSTKVVNLVAILKYITMLKIPLAPTKIEMIENRMAKYQTLTNESKKLKNDNPDFDVENYDVIEKKVLDKYGEESMENVYMKLYKVLPARDDFYLEIENSRTKSSDDTKNYIIIPKKTTSPGLIILNRYKTAQTFGKQVVNIPLALTTLIRTMITKKKLGMGDHLFGPNKELSTYVSKFLKSVGISPGSAKLGIKYLRHSIATTEYRKGNTIEHRIILAKKMMHSIDTHNNIYIRGYKPN
jgi:hypothetical protein